MTMRLSRNFTLAEMVATSHRRLQDTPTLGVVQNLQRLCVLVLAYRIPDTCKDGLPTSIATTSTMQK